MKVLYLGCFCEPTTMPLINKRTKGRISVSATTFQRALLHGYDKLEYKPNYIVNVPDIGSFPMRCSSPFFPRSKFEFASMKGVNGAFFNFFPDWETYGVELDPIQVEIAKTRCTHIFQGDLKTVSFPSNNFDYITIQDALDHSNNPVETVRHCYNLLKPGGVLAIKVHNISCLLSKICGSHFYAIIPPDHLFYFNLKTLQLLLNKNGFKFHSYYYNTQKLKFSTSILRVYKGKPTGIGNYMYNIIQKHPFLNFSIYKNFHDLITVFGIKAK